MVIESGLFPDMLDNLDTLAYEFTKQFNAVHQEGWSIEDYNSGVHTPVDFFSYGDAELTSIKGAAKLLQVSEEIMNSTDHIAAAYHYGNNEVTIGNSENALRLAEVKNSAFIIGGNTTTFQNYYEGIIGEMAVYAQEAERFTNNSQILTDAVNDRRQSISSVSLDEEMTNMIQFQQAYNASARMITIQDEILDRIINGMGLSGR
jgi:flagellar hook-associated protein 1 FlgK